MCKAFLVGGIICTAAMIAQNFMIENGVSEKMAGTYITIILIMTAQLLTGFGVFDRIGKFAGAGVIIPITGFANAMVAPAIEYKKEGQVFGIGCKIFTIAGPVILYGIFTSWLLGVIYWIGKMMGVV
jgi:stage V sporulation protein AC